MTSVNVELDPVAQASLDAGITLTGGATAWGILSDDDDASFLEWDGADGSDMSVTILFDALPTLPTGSVLQVLRWTGRMSTNDDTTFNFVGLRDFTATKSNGDPVEYVSLVQGPQSPWDGTVHDYASTYIDRFPDGTKITDVGWDAEEWSVVLSPALASGAGTGGKVLRFHELRLEVTYAEAPTVTVTGPSDPASTAKPTVTWTYSDTAGDPQTAYEVIIVPESALSFVTGYGYVDPTDPLFDPSAADSITWSSGRVSSSSTSAKVQVGLEDGATYYPCVRARKHDAFSGEVISGWDVGTAFTVTVTPPAVPDLVVTSSPTTGTNRVQVNESAHATPRVVAFDVERSEDGGATWQTVRGGDTQGDNVGLRTDGTAFGLAQAGAHRAAWDDINPDLRWHGNLSDYTPAADACLASIWNDLTGDERQWAFTLLAGGTLRLTWSADGLAGTVVTADASATTGITDGSDVWLRATLDRDNPWTVKFYKSTDGTTWTQIGNNVVGAAAATVYASPTEHMFVHGFDRGAGKVPVGICYSFSVRDLDTGAVVAAPDFVANAQPSGTWYDDRGVPWALNGNAYLEQQLDLNDVEATPGADALYRARSWRDDSEESASAWVEDGPVTLPAAGWIKDPLGTVPNLQVTVVAVDKQRRRPGNVLEPIGRTKAVVPNLGLRGYLLAVELRVPDRASYAALTALLDAGTTLLLQSPLSEQWYVQVVGDVSFPHERTPDPADPTTWAYHHRVTFTAVEVEAP